MSAFILFRNLRPPAPALDEAASETMDGAPMSTLEAMQQRRLRGLDEMHELETLRLCRPLHGYEERCLRRSRSLVLEMDAKLLELERATRRSRGQLRLADSSDKLHCGQPKPSDATTPRLDWSL